MTRRLALAQVNATVGALEENRDKALFYIDRARHAGADIVVFPEMWLTGYPPEDLLLKPDFVAASQQVLDSIAKATAGCTVVVGTLYAADELYNAAAVFHNGWLAGVYHKRYLPNYGVFDEHRYFRAGQQRQVFCRDGIVFGVSICEDIWYPDGPPTEQALYGGAHLLINISASPYHIGKGRARERMLATRAADLTSVVAYCNLVGGQDELVFDGQSMICGPSGEVIARGAQFEEELLVADIDFQQVLRRRVHDPRSRAHEPAANIGFDRMSLNGLPPRTDPRQPIARPLATPLEDPAEVYSALVLGTRDYVRKNGFRQAVLGLSGGIDSALTAVIAVDALGPENVVCVAMPTRYSSSNSTEDSRALTANLRCRYCEIPIDGAFQSYLDMLAPVVQGRPSDITEQNIQPRVRGTLLMALSNQFGWLVLTTGNKSEIGVGYSTLYGDTAGGFAVIKDVPKTLVYRLSRYRNRQAGRDLIPRSILEKPPSAELRPDQKDTDSLPDYSVLDPILDAYVEQSRSFADIVAGGFDADVVREVIRMVHRNEYKRRQSPPGVKITERAFGKDWRLPVTHQYGG